MLLIWKQYNLILYLLTGIGPQVMFTSPESIAVEGDVVTICLAVISGEITTPTNINLTTFPVDNPHQYPSANSELLT